VVFIFDAEKRVSALVLSCNEQIGVGDTDEVERGQLEASAFFLSVIYRDFVCLGNED
jgi:hypothetical protein